MNPVESFLALLADVKKAGKGWSARCPAHDDRRASLSIAVGDDGAVLIHCHAGCEKSAIVAAVGWKLSDLFPPKAGAMPSTNGRPASTGRTFATASEAVADLERRHGKRSALWTYHDAQGEPIGVVVRWDKATGKDIRPVSRHGDGWRIGAMPDPRPLYGLPGLAAAGRVIVCEGEKAADAARSLGSTATTSAGGSQAAAKTDWRPLAGKEVWILPDNDLPGRKYADTVAGILAKLAPAPMVRIVELPGVPESGDIVDWIDAHGDAAEPDAMRAEIEALAKAAHVWTPAATPEPGPVLTCLADVDPRPVSWLWPGRIPLGRITLLVGRPGERKSFLTIDAVSRVSTGTPWPDGSVCPKGSVILISAEDDPADTIRPRLDAHYADVRRVHLLSAVRCADDKGTHERLITLADVDAIETALARMPDCKLIVVDPIGSFLGGQTDAHRDNEVRGILAPVAALAEKYGPAVLVVAHRRKSAGSIADDLALGSRAFTGIARAVWHLTRDPENKSRRLMLPGKNNLAREGDGLAFSIIGDPPRIAWERDPVTMTADDALAAESQSRARRPGPNADAVNAATDWLRTALASGPRLAKELLDEWKNGQGGSKRTLDRARQSLQVEAYRPEVPGPWWWRLATNIATAPKNGELGNLGNLGENKGKTADLDADNAKVAKLSDLGNLGFGSYAQTLDTNGTPALFDEDNSAGPYGERH